MNLAHVHKGECPLCHEARGLYRDLSIANGKLRCRACWKSCPQNIVPWKLPAIERRTPPIIDEGGPFTEAEAATFRELMERSRRGLRGSAGLLPRPPSQWPIPGTAATEDEVSHSGDRSQDAANADEYAIQSALEVVDRAHYAGGVDYGAGTDTVAVTVFEADGCGGHVILDTLVGEAAREVAGQAFADAGEESVPLTPRDGRRRRTFLGGGGIGLAAMMMLALRNRRD